MKITFVTPNLEMHGGNLVMLKYADHLIKKGHSVKIITSSRQTLTDINPKIELKKFQAFPIRYVDFFFLQQIYNKKVRSLIEECDFIVPIYTPMLPAVIKAKKKKKLQAKIVLLFQDSFAMIWAGPFIKKMLSGPALCKNLDSAVCIGKSTESAFRGVCKVKTEVITSGIDLEIFYDRKVPKEDYILFVGRPQTPKGFPYFKEAAKIIAKSHPKIRAKVVAPTVRDQTIDGIEYIKYRDREQLAELYNRATVFVSASLSESFGLPPLEAMASNTAVVMTNTVGAQEYAKDGQNSLIVPTKDSKELANAVVKLLGNSDLMASIQKEGLRTAKNFGWSQSLKDFENYLISRL